MPNAMTEWVTEPVTEEQIDAAVSEFVEALARLATAPVVEGKPDA